MAPPLLYIGITNAVFVAVFMLCKRPNMLSDKIVAIWMVFLALPMFTRLCSIAYPTFVIPGLFSIKSFPLTFGPFLWLYTNVLIDRKRVFTKRDLWHFLPFSIFALLQIIFPEQFFFPSSDGPPPSFLERIHGMTILLSLLGYSGVVLWLLKQHRQNVLDHFSSLPIQVTLKWLQWLTIGFITAYILPVAAPLLNFPPLFQRHGLAFTGFIFILGFFGLKQSPVFQAPVQKDEKNLPTHEECSQEASYREERAGEKRYEPTQEKPTRDKKPVKGNQEQKYERSGLTDDLAQDYLRQLEDYMQHAKPYLETDLTIEKLAKQIRISKHHLTQTLNEQLNKNFYMYINEYRINDVKQRLLDPKNEHLTLLAIAYESGFNSKSTFNAVFKKFTTMTPSQFRKSQAQA